MRSFKDIDIFWYPVKPSLAPTYLDVIKKPMDLGSIQTKLEVNSYNSRDKFMEDINQVFLNLNSWPNYLILTWITAFLWHMVYSLVFSIMINKLNTEKRLFKIISNVIKWYLLNFLLDFRKFQNLQWPRGHFDKKSRNYSEICSGIEIAQNVHIIK